MAVRRSAVVVATGVLLLLTLPPVQAQNGGSATTAASAQVVLDIPATDLKAALDAFVKQSGRRVRYTPSQLAGKSASPVKGTMSADAGLEQLLAGSGLNHYARADGGFDVTDAVRTLSVAAVPVAAAPEAVETRKKTDAQQLQEVVVTATKRKKSVRSIPSTINVLSGEKLAAQGARELQDFVDQVPGLQIQDVAVTSSRKIVIRGIAPDNTTNQTVGTLLGDVPLGDPIGSYTVVDPDTWDLETVEVLKGPQGTLFGASSLAGVIRYVPNAPKLGEWQAKGVAEYVKTRDGGAAPTYSAALNLPAGDTLAFRLSGTLEHRPGVIDIENPARNEKDADDARKKSGRAMLLWQPTDRFTANAWYTAQQRRSDEPFFVTNFDYDYTRRDAPEPSPSRRSFSLGALDLRYRFDWATLVSLSAYQRKKNQFDFEASYALASDSGEAGMTALRTFRDVDAHGVMQEFRLVSPDTGKWTWQTGVFYSQYDAAIYSDIYTPQPDVLGLGPVLALLPPELVGSFVSERGVSIGNSRLDPLEASEAALFGELTRKFGSVDVTLGGRLYKTRIEGLATSGGLTPAATNGSPETMQDLSVTGDGFSPKLAATWKVSKEVLVYGGVSRGFQYGGVNAIAVPATTNMSIPETYGSSALWSYETGIRTDWFGRRLRADLSAYFQQWSNAQVSQVAEPATAYIDNVGDVEVRGVELSLRYLLPITGLLLDTNGSYIQSKTTSVFTDSDGNDIPSGTTMPNTPKFQGAATLSYSRLFGERWETNTALIYTHAGPAFGDIQHQGRLDARNMLNFNFTVTRGSARFSPSFGVVVNNITDQRKIVSSTQSPENDTDTDGINYPVGYTRPRTIILRLGAEFR